MGLENNTNELNKMGSTRCNSAHKGLIANITTQRAVRNASKYGEGLTLRSQRVN